MNYLIIVMTALLAGIMQGVTGFGSCIVMMMVFPFLFSIPEGAGLAVAVTIFLSLSVAIRYRKEIQPKKLIPLAVLYVIVSSVAIRFSSLVDPVLIKRIFGAFMIVLSVYFLFFAKSVQGKKLSTAAVIVCVTVSAICDGLFGIGGPLMVLVIMGMTSSPKEYLGSILFISTISCFCSTVVRFASGILALTHVPYIAAGIAGILAGVFIAGKIVDKLNADMLRKITYLMIGVAGVINLLSLT